MKSKLKLQSVKQLKLEIGQLIGNRLQKIGGAVYRCAKSRKKIKLH